MPTLKENTESDDSDYMNRVELITRVTRKQLKAMSRTQRERLITRRRSFIAQEAADREDAHFWPVTPRTLLGGVDL